MELIKTEQQKSNAQIGRKIIWFRLCKMNKNQVVVKIYSGFRGIADCGSMWTSCEWVQSHITLELNRWKGINP